MELDFERDVRIDPDALDVEWLQQGELYGRYAREAAAANDRVKRAEQKLKVVKSELILYYKKEDPKATAQVLEALYRTDKEHEEAKEEYFQAVYEAEMLNAAVYAMGHRKVALENLVKLVTSSYFASPREPRDLNSEFSKRLESRRDQAREDTRDSIKKSLNKRRTK